MRCCEEILDELREGRSCTVVGRLDEVLTSSGVAFAESGSCS